jgi:hypothetical protein
VIVGILGRAGAGKDTAADMLVKNLGFQKVALADPMKRFCREVFDFSEGQMWGPSEERNKPDPRYVRVRRGSTGVFGEEARVHVDPPEDVYLTPRHALQQLGTEWGRSCYRDVWVDLAIRTAEKIAGGGCIYDRKLGPRYFTFNAEFGSEQMVKTKRSTVIPDVRFRNEVDALRAAGARLIRVVRRVSGLSGAAGRHVSETEQEEVSDAELDAVWVNDGTLKALEKKVAQAAEGWLP